MDDTTTTSTIDNTGDFVNDYSLIYQAGIGVMVLQCVLHFIFAKVLKNGPWTQQPSFTAHQTICLPLMVCYTSIGFYGWFFTESLPTTPWGRVASLQELEWGLWLSKIVLGTQLFWDLPYEFLFKSSKEREGAMVAHHVGMATVAAIHVGIFSNGIPVAPYYAFFFFGVIEISSFFLTVVDVFHPKQKAWYAFLQQQQQDGILVTLNEICRVTFAITYLLVRTIYFPYVGFGFLVPDFAHVASLDTAEERNNYSKTLLYSVIVILTLFAFLQIYWGMLIAKQVAKAMGLVKSNSDDDGDNKKSK